MSSSTAISAADLGAKLEELLATHGVPGAQATVLDGDELIEAAAGVLNLRTGQPATPESLFLPGSIGKLYTATVVMGLVDEGALDLDAPLLTYLPDMKTRDLDALAAVTIRHLLVHTSGFDGDHFTDTGRGDDALARYIEECAELAHICTPGTVWSYCNAGYAMLGRVVEVVTGDVWETALRDRLLTPLGLTHTVLFPEEALLYGVAVGHVPDDDDPDRLTVTPQWALARAFGPMGASIIASASDVLRFARLHLDGGLTASGERLVGKDTVPAMQTEQIRLVDPSVLGQAWGLGWILDRWGDVRIIGHDGNSLGQNAFMRIAPEERFGICLQTNVGSAMAMYRELATWAFSRRLGVAPPPPPEARPLTAPLDAARYAGKYEREGLVMDVGVGEDGLAISFHPSGPGAIGVPVMENIAAPWVEGDMFLVELPIADDALAAVFFNPDDPDGRPTYVHFGGRAARRAA
jgi:CubicO group peptidase (beta-lactamase class C family)